MAKIARQILPTRTENLNGSTKAPARGARVIAVVPAYNEAQSIANVIEELRAVRVNGYDLELVVVDDGSRDATADRARATNAEVVSLPFNMGIGLAVQTGFRYALVHGANCVVQVDGDGQHIPDEIAKLLGPIESGDADVVVGSRFALGASDGLVATTGLRWLAGRMLSFTVRFLTGNRVSDPTSGFRAFNNRAARFVARDYPDDYPEVQVLVSLARHGFRIAEVPVRMRGREHGKSSINWWRAIYYVIKVTFASFMDRMRRREDENE